MWVRRGCALVVAGVAAYSSYAHQRHFALVGGPTQSALPCGRCRSMGCSCWPALVWSAPGRAPQCGRGSRCWVAFLLGVAVSLAANIAAAPTLSWQPVLVAGWPPLALLLAVELVVHSRSRDQIGTVQTWPETTPTAELEPEFDAIESVETETETVTETDRRASRPAAARRSISVVNPSAEAVM
jgi:hypothetical protein